MKRLFPMRIYIAGPMTGLPEFNKPAFMVAEKYLGQEGFEVINPAHNHGEDWNDYMRQSLHQVATADGLYMLEGWRQSKGANLEHKIAQELGLVIRYESDRNPSKVRDTDGEAMCATSPAKDKDLRMMKFEGASTADLGRELLKEFARGTIPLHSINTDLKILLQWTSTLPIEAPIEVRQAARRLRDLTHP